MFRASNGFPARRCAGPRPHVEARADTRAGEVRRVTSPAPCFRSGGRKDLGGKLPKQAIGNLAGIEDARGEALLRELRDCSAFAALECGAEREFTLDGCGLAVVAMPNQDSRLELEIEEGTDAVVIRDGSDVLATGRLSNTQSPWAGARLDNGMSIESALPFMSDTIIDPMFHYVCGN